MNADKSDAPQNRKGENKTRRDRPRACPSNAKENLPQKHKRHD